MPTIPTGKMELELRRLYVRWLSRLGDETNMDKAVDQFEKQSLDLIEKMGGQTARLGALADFPAPKRLDLSPHIGTIYSDMKQAAIQAGIQAGLNASDVARHMFRNGMDKSYHRLNRLARTETVSAYWKNAWDSIADLPELVMVWGAESGPRTCQWCLERDGMVMESSQLRDHPNGRCTPIPTLRSMVEYKGSVDTGGRIYQDPAWAKKQPPPARPAKPSVAKPMSASEANAWGAANVTDIKSLSEDIQEQVRLYTGGGYKGTNRTLRAGGQFTGANGKVQREMVQAIDKGMKLSKTVEDIDVSRVFTLDAFGGKTPDSLIGKVFSDKGYLSTAVGKPPSGPFNSQVTMQLKVPAGTPAIWTRPISQFKSERELLLNRGTKIIIDSATLNERTGKWLIEAHIAP